MDTRDASRSLEAYRNPNGRAPVSWRMPSRLRPAPDGEGAGGLISPKSIFRGFLRYRWAVLGLWFVGSAALCAFIFLKLKPSYAATSRLQFNLAVEDPFARNQRTTTQSETRQLETQKRLITSPSILEQAINEPEVARIDMIREANDPLALLQEELQVDILPNTTLIEVTLEADSSQDASRIVNAVVKAFKDQSPSWSASFNERLIERLKEVETKVSQDAAVKQKQLVELVNKGNIDPSAFNTAEDGEAPDQIAATIQEAVQVRTNLFAIQNALAGAQAELEARREAIGRMNVGDGGLSTEIAIQQDPELNALLSTWNAAYQRYDAEKKKYRNGGPNDPVVKALSAQALALQTDYETMKATKAAQYQQNPAALMGQDSEREIQDAELKVRSLAGQEEQIRRQLDRLNLTNTEESSDRVVAKILEAELAAINGSLAQVQERLRSLEFESLEQNPFTVIDSARQTDEPAADRRWILMLAVPPALMIGLLGLFGLLEARSGRVNCPDDLSKRVQVEVFSIPPLPQLGPGGAMAALEGPKSSDVEVEEFANRLDHLRVALCETPRVDGRAHCVLVTSAVGGEGKTTLAAQLAARCADSGVLTLLIDADLRRASLSRLFDAAESAGLGEVLRGEVALEDVLLDLPQFSGCKLLAAGGPVSSPGRVFQGPKLGETLERLRGAFDVILIDTPPVLPVPDALSIGRHSDGALLVTRHDESRLPLLEQARKLLTSIGLPLMGVVVNGVRPPSIRHAAYSYQYHSDRRP